MHLIFHGVLADVIDVIHDFFADHRMTKGFERRANKILLDIMDLRLEWCKVKNLPKTQWLAENKLGYARVMIFLYAKCF